MPSCASIHRVNLTLETRGVARGDPSSLTRALGEGCRETGTRDRTETEARPKGCRLSSGPSAQNHGPPALSRSPRRRPSGAFGAAPRVRREFRIRDRARDGAREGRPRVCRESAGVTVRPSPRVPDRQGKCRVSRRGPCHGCQRLSNFAWDGPGACGRRCLTLLLPIGPFEGPRAKAAPWRSAPQVQVRASSLSLAVGRGVGVNLAKREVHAVVGAVGPAFKPGSGSRPDSRTARSGI